VGEEETERGRPRVEGRREAGKTPPQHRQTKKKPMARGGPKRGTTYSEASRKESSRKTGDVHVTVRKGGPLEDPLVIEAVSVWSCAADADRKNDAAEANLRGSAA